ncbi:MAG: bifunctional 3-deoxy-7-phosphoheptulonate synthase/chorismate mutase [Peptococcaceae bacterium]|jgi:3-deoxy-7-phosphoheptulonate synthase/chorismate mutase|nr:bifunctional 3-deoxy-7-phosphoheptulonate synthase/chorismate mutase [Peptococcaceae bacterium]MDH7525034.1 bifunctional 3-deoxy-7-phosphoheptulonate synthase/chorismate mutase [Peptococcaceae bacterium]
MARELKALREEIDDINLSILDLLNKRTSLLKEIVDLKDQKGMEYFDAEREAEMTEKILRNNRGPLNNELVKEIFNMVFAASLKYMGMSRERKLLISSGSPEKFDSIQEMFNLDSKEAVIIAGPCAVEKPEYLETVAGVLKEKGIGFLRGGAYKPRTSPYDFQGLRAEGLKILHDVAKKYDLYTVTEVVDTRDVELVAEYADVLQIGARNMYNYELLKEVGQSNCPVLLKRGLNATIQEFLYAAEYIVLRGNKKVIMCERGIRTFETKTRNTLDLSSIPIIKKETHLPIVVDLSHSLGRKDIVNHMASAALSAGADGLMVEVHPYPELALSDSKQQLSIGEFEEMLNFVRKREY